MAIFRTTLTASFRGMLMQNVLHFDTHGSGIQPNTINEIVRDQWISEYKFFSVDQVIWINIASQIVDPTTGFSSNLAINIPCTGNITSASDHPSICEKIKVFTATAGRHGRGRIYAPVASLFGANVGVLKPETIAARNARLDTLLARFNDDNPQFGITYGIIPRDTPSAFKPAVLMRLDSRYGIQRRRNIGVGV